MLRTSLLLLGLALLVILLTLWVDTQGKIRHIHWAQPEPKSLDVAGLITPLPVRNFEQGQFLETLDRPLFSPSRRPPPPPQPSAPPEEAASPLTGVHIYGIYGTGSQGGAILGVDGKNLRLAVNQAVKGWQLVSIDGNRLTFRRGTRQHVLELVHYIPPKGAKVTSVAPAQSVPQISVQAPAQPEQPVASTPPTPASPPQYGGIQSRK
ncbi:hypothetical protein G7045_01335 [Acidovorax sp. HDW3]|uniref:hypothetical protein n=1 Tax=Acidovorax sp. HDW3 TaxID=2714923 RepID=UPI00140DF573|nr:hypothetical protein [Acidovorax sp. HDW3]QIL43011.1 hypothetical protein G7045_01335 [Acidovorax sp. HDW3]